MTMSDMRGRLYDAALKAFESHGECEYVCDGPSGVRLDGRFDLETVIDAILTELQEPTPEMVKAMRYAACDELGLAEDFGAYGEDSDYEAIFAAAILAAKKAPG